MTGKMAITASSALAALLALQTPGIAGSGDQRAGSGESMARTKSSQGDSQAQGGPERRSKFWEVSGRVDRAKKVRILGGETEHLVALIGTDEGRWMAVDLGPTDDLRDVRIRTGDWIAAQGPIGRMGERRVMMAHRVVTDGR